MYLNIQHHNREGSQGRGSAGILECLWPGNSGLRERHWPNIQDGGKVRVLDKAVQESQESGGGAGLDGFLLS